MALEHTEGGSIAQRLKQIRDSLPKDVTLVAVSKTHPVEALQEAYDAGQRIFGENKVQEMTAKAALLPKDIEWHFIGHLQRNKIKMMAPYVTLIQGVDSFEKLKEIDKYAALNSRHIAVLMQVHIAREDTKFGLSAAELISMLKDENWQGLEHITIEGLMGMATNTDNTEQIVKEFTLLASLFSKLKQQFFSDRDYFRVLSAGMSDDYPLAISAGSNMVRIGSSIFGERDYGGVSS